jgi:hypothetical protein
VFNSAPATLICVLNNTAFNAIHITKLANNETQWIGRVNPDTSVELSQFSIYQNITLKLVNRLVFNINSSSISAISWREHKESYMTLRNKTYLSKK